MFVEVVRHHRSLGCLFSAAHSGFPSRNHRKWMVFAVNRPPYCQRGQARELLHVVNAGSGEKNTTVGPAGSEFRYCALYTISTIPVKNISQGRPFETGQPVRGIRIRFFSPRRRRFPCGKVCVFRSTIFPYPRSQGAFHPLGEYGNRFEAAFPKGFPLCNSLWSSAIRATTKRAGKSRAA